MSKKTFKPKYSGSNSKRFWEKINGIKKKEGKAAYSMACALQDHEDRVLMYLNDIVKKGGDS